ncbi:MAG: prephenate dehydratase domain-containing protein [bacterium]
MSLVQILLVAGVIAASLFFLARRVKVRVHNSKLVVASLLISVGVFAASVLERFAVGLPWTESITETMDWHVSYSPGPNPPPALLIPRVQTIAPVTMRIDETADLVLRFELPDTVKCLVNADTATVEVMAPGLDVEPLGARVVPIGIDGVFKTDWLIRPKSEGNHRIVINTTYPSGQWESIYDCAAASNVWILTRSTQRDSKEVSVAVMTIWGVSRPVFMIAQALLSIIGVSILFPLVVKIFEVLIVDRFFGVKDKEPIQSADPSNRRPGEQLVSELVPKENRSAFTCVGPLVETSSDHAGLQLVSAIVASKATRSIQVIGRGSQWLDSGTRGYVSAVAAAVVRGVRYERILVVDPELAENTLLWLMLLERFVASTRHRELVTIYKLDFPGTSDLAPQFQIVDGDWFHRVSRSYRGAPQGASCDSHSLFAVAPHPDIEQAKRLFEQHRTKSGPSLNHQGIVTFLCELLRTFESESYRLAYHSKLVFEVQDFLNALNVENMPPRSLLFIGCLMPHTFTYEAAAEFCASKNLERDCLPVVPLPFSRLDEAAKAFVEQRIDYLCVPIATQSDQVVLPPTLDSGITTYLSSTYDEATRIRLRIQFVLAGRMTTVTAMKSIAAVGPALSHVTENLTGRLKRLPLVDVEVESNFHAAWVASQDATIGAITTREAADYLNLNVLGRPLEKPDSYTEFAIYGRGTP